MAVLPNLTREQAARYLDQEARVFDPEVGDFVSLGKTHRETLLDPVRRAYEQIAGGNPMTTTEVQWRDIHGLTDLSKPLTPSQQADFERFAQDINKGQANVRRTGIGILSLIGGGALAAGGAGGAAAGAAEGGASAGASGAAGLGSGITPGASAAGISGASASGTALAPGYFAAEGITPAVASTGAGGISGSYATGALAPGYFASEGLTAGGGAAAGGASGGGSSLAPTNNGGILNTGLTPADLLRGVPGVIGAIASDRQADSYDRLANAYMQMGAPSRQRFEASFAPDFSMENDPGYLDALRQAARANAHALSVGSGNPYGNPNALMQSQADLYQRFAYPALQEYRRLNSGAGGLSQYASAAPGAAGAGIQAQGNVFNSLGGAAADIFNPPSSLESALRILRGVGNGAR